MRWLAAALVLTACSGDTAREVLPEGEVSALRQAAALVRGRLGRDAADPPPDVAAVRAALTPELIAQLPAPTLLMVHEASGGVSLPQRIASSAGVETYLTEDDVTFAFRDDVLVGSRGFGFDLTESDVSAAVLAIRAGAGRATRVHGWLDGLDRIVTRAFDCTYATEGARVVERCFAIGLSFENSYVLRGGRIVASRQWLGPVNGYISIERVRL